MPREAGGRDSAQADYVLIGAGSAGCVIANRLSEDKDSKVVLLEAGGDDRPLANLSQFATNMFIHIPVGFAYLLTDPKAAWLYRSEPDPSTGGRVHPFPRGRVLGGSSSINGLIYVRGIAQDYDGWRQLGCHGWGWSDVLPLMIRSEDRHGPENEFVGKGGPQSVVYGPRYGATEAFMDACAEAGIPRDVDMNAGGDEGVDRMQMIARGGFRSSTARSYLHPVTSRRNLKVVTEAFVTRLLFEGRRAVGVEYRRGRELHRVYARREVILAAGAINSPKLLQLSGIGAGKDLAAFGITPLVDSPRVGKNLQDHFGVTNSAVLKNRDDSFNYRTRGWRLAVEALTFAAFRNGVLSNPTGNVSGFMRSRPELDLPDVQVYAGAGSVNFQRTELAGRMIMGDEPGLSAGLYPSRPLSRGEINLRSADPDAPPVIIPRFLSDPYDQKVLVDALRRVRSIFDMPAMARVIERINPPADRIPQMSDEEMIEDAKARGYSVYHACGTCEMSGDDRSVVDPELRVRGVEGLRVADSSVMPRITSGNLNATVIMIGEKCADMVKATWAAGRAAQAA